MQFLDSSGMAKTDKLKIPASVIQKATPSIFAFLPIHLRQRRIEKLYQKSGVNFRKTDPNIIQSAYGSMDDRGFAAINGRQNWANWRTIPLALNRTVDQRPLQVLDAGCGPGSSSRILAYYLPLGSEIYGIDVTAGLIQIAKNQKYVHHTGASVKTQFAIQSLTQSFYGPDDKVIEDKTMDLVHTSGVVGHHLDEKQVSLFAKEAFRVLKDGSIAVIDAGPRLKAKTVIKVFESLGFQWIRYVKPFPISLLGQIVFSKS